MRSIRAGGGEGRLKNGRCGALTPALSRGEGEKRGWLGGCIEFSGDRRRALSTLSS